MTKLSEMPLTNFDTHQAFYVAREALDRLELDDDDSDQLNTAMGWIADSLGIDEMAGDSWSRWRQWRDLEPESFAECGTRIQTTILEITKPRK